MGQSTEFSEFRFPLPRRNISCAIDLLIVRDFSVDGFGDKNAHRSATEVTKTWMPIKISNLNEINRGIDSNALQILKLS